MLPAIMILLAAAGPNPLDPPEIGEPVKVVVLGIVSILGVAILVLTFAKLWMDVLGKRAGTTVNIQAHTEGEGKDTPAPKGATIDVTGFVATRDFETHKEEARLRAVGLEKQISDSRHEWRNELNAVLQAARLRDETTEEWRSEMSKEAKENGQKLAAVEKQADMIQATQENMDRKLDRLIERNIQPARTS